ncbi:MAG TPA: hypothetical protein VGI81_15130 [Tepidisphaeraceae bacterium]|jgi:hypothetical protein
MKATLDIPDEVAREVQRRADRAGREFVEQIAELVKLALRVPDNAAAGGTVTAGPGTARQGALTVATDPATGLPIIHSPPDAPVHSMTVNELSALTEAALSEDDLERAGLSLRR